MRRLLAWIGRGVLSFLEQLGSILELLVRIARYIPRAFRDRHLVLQQMAIVGADSLPLVVLIGSFTGAIAALQATNLFAKFNLIAIARPYIGGSIATVVFTELTPVLTALVIAGRVGGAIAAQIGTMAVSEQLDALEMMAIDRDRYLGMPRVVAALTMMPVLAVFSNVVALVGAFVLTALKFGFSAPMFFDSIVRFFRTSEVTIGLVKSMVFGGTTALIGCYVGMQTTGGAEGVGNSTVRAFTISAASILVLDALFGYVV
ncbi:MAG: ABC transporter permease [Bacteroidota bacterium]|nr:ABC transporter permease [Candidatus Kapabacteria bacterium]MCS7303245.1 ABC transporter permease [Candidatus Kapabacteria bacterium]MCX7937086.1 ABC transporter permease [Chlorobiota bacterium]MDW8075185.1 ABC transporter permease [Bacteroidota bacterium]MDW8272416.1 ABC transporter permease [Bacteroidota bacterium]